MSRARTWLLPFLLLPLGVPAAVAAEPAAPPPPSRYKVTVRYRLAAARNERIRLFFDMVHHLEALGFVKDEGPDTEPVDPSQTEMTGTISADKSATARARAHRFLADPYVKAVLLVPDGYKLPAEADKPVRVQMDLAPGLPRERQRLLADQLLEKLRSFGFREAVGYYNRGHTRMVGTIPAGNLDKLLRDMRYQPSGWLVPETPLAEQPQPIRDISPIQVVEVMPEPAGEAAAGKELPALEPLPLAPAPADKISADLRAVLDEKAQAGQFRRLEIILTYVPSDADPIWVKVLTRRAPGLILEGRFGEILTVLARPDQAPALAELTMVSAIRLPQPALVSPGPTGAKPDANARTLKASGLERLHAHGYKGAGVRVAIIDSDFRGYQPFLGKGLPARVAFIDLTRERRRNLQPEPYPDDGVTFGHGTACALVLALAAPQAEMTLIRIDPAAPYQLLAAAHYINGDPFVSHDIENRQQQLIDEDTNLSDRRAALIRERRIVFNNFGQDPESVKRRQDYLKRQAELAADERAHTRLYDQLQELIANRRTLKGIGIVSSSLVWNDGYPLAGSGSLSRYFDDTPFRGVWFQAAGNTRGQGWSGLFRDRDGDRVMEFSASPEPPRPDLWTNELNFLSWAPRTGNPTPELPAGATVRIAVQWREPHDPEFATDAEDVYLRPLALVRLVVLRQLDPEGKTRPADDLEVIAWSSGLPERLDNRPDAATYRAVVEFKTPVAGRYALRVEGVAPAGLRPPELGLPGPQPSWELHPEIFVEAVDAATRKAGRPVFRDYASDGFASLGIPGDARQVVTVGAAGPLGAPRPYSAGGPPSGSRFLFKPDVYAYDDLVVGPGGTPPAYGTDVAAPFAAGLMASRFSAGVRPGEFVQSARARPGNLVRAPENKAARPR